MMKMQEIEPRPVKKRRFFVEDSEQSNSQKRKSPDAEVSNGIEVSKKATSLEAGLNDHSHDNSVNGHIDEAVCDRAGQDILDPNAFRAVVGEDVSEGVIETIREMSGNSLTRGQSYSDLAFAKMPYLTVVTA